MKFLVKHQLTTLIFSELIEELNREKPTHLLWLGATEYNFPEHWDYEGYIEILEKTLLKNNTILEFVTGNASSGLYILNGVFPKVNTNLHFFPMYWVYGTLYPLLNNPPIVSTPQPNIEEKLYINLNRNPHKFRCLLMDELAKENLIDRGYNTWMRPGFYGDVHEFKHWKEQKLILKHDSIPDGNDKHSMFLFTPPNEYFSSYINLTCESTDDFIFYTEKTIKNFYFKKPFIILGAQNINTMLKYWGFEIYDEIFDYSFDSLPNIEDRIKGVVNNIKNLTSRSYNEISQLTYQKTKHNYNRVMEIYYKKEYIPPMLEYFLKQNHPQMKYQPYAF